MSLADAVGSWTSADGRGEALLAGLTSASWLSSTVPSFARDKALEGLARRLREPAEFEVDIGQHALELIRRLQSSEALRRTTNNDSPAVLHLAQLRASPGTALQPPAPIWWLAIDDCPGRRMLPNALLQQLWQTIAGGVAEGDDPRPYARCVLIVSITGPDRARPDLIAVGPAGKSDEPARDAACIRTFHFSRMHTQSATYIRSKAEELERGLSSVASIAAFFHPGKEGDARTVVRNELREQLGTLMTLLEQLPRAARASSPEDLAALREAASVLVFRMMFLGEIESRGLLWAAGADRRQLVDASSAALDDEVATGERRRNDDLFGVFRVLSATLRGSREDADVEVRGGSLFLTRPNERFDPRVVAYLDAFDAQGLELDPDTRDLWRDVLARTYQITQGVVVHRASGAATGRGDVGYLGLGGTEHVHRVLGDVYEQILALEPKRVGESIELDVAGKKNERKKLGAHYTPESLVEELVRPALGALFVHHWADCRADRAEYARRVAALRVLDPAMGSAHFLTVAAREISTELEWVERFGHPRHVEDPDAHEPLRQRDPLLGHSKTPEGSAIREGLVRRLREVVQRCCHGVDVSPIAVELGKLSLWLFTMAAQKLQRVASVELARPELAFLDANIQCGDSLIGVFWKDVGPVLHERFGVKLVHRVGEGRTSTLGLFDQGKGTLVTERIDEVSRLLSWVHGPDHAVKEYADKSSWLENADRTSPYAVRRAVHARVQTLLADLRWVYDLATLAVFFDVRLRGKAVLAAKLAAELAKWRNQPSRAGGIDWERVVTEPLETNDAEVKDVRSALTRLALEGAIVAGRPLRAFHWGLAFPDVFPGSGGGFDLIVANPPFIGDRELRSRIGEEAKGTLNRLHTDHRRGGTCDLSGFFVLRFDDLLAPKRGIAATLAANSLAQAKNRRTVMVPLTTGELTTTGPAFRIARAHRSFVWPGDAAVHVCTVQLTRWVPPRRILVAGDGDRCTASDASFISTFLDEYPDGLDGRTDGMDLPGMRTGVFFQGMVQRGDSGGDFDFIKAPELALDFLNEVAACGEQGVLYAYLNNEVVQNSRRPFAATICIDFYDALSRAGLETADSTDQLEWLKATYPRCIESVSGVREKRLKLPPSQSNSKDREYWWSYNSPRVELRRLWSEETTVIVVGRAASKIWTLTSIPRIDPHWGLPVCPSEALNVLPSSGKTAFSVLQSALAELHVRRNSSTLKSDLRFSPDYALIGFPFPWPTGWSTEEGCPYPLPAPPHAQLLLNDSGEHLTAVRNSLLAEPESLLPEVSPVPADWGPTALYNLYDDGAFHAPGIQPLRQAHVDLLDAVLGAYALDPSLPLSGPMMAKLRSDMAAEEGHGWAFERPWIDGTERFVPKAAYRGRIIEGLLQANLERFQQEIALFVSQITARAQDDAKLGARLAKGVTPAALAKELKALDEPRISLHPDDAGAVLEAACSGGGWVRTGVGEDATYAWVARLTPAERQHREAAAREDEEHRRRKEAEDQRAAGKATPAKNAEADPKPVRRRPSVVPKPPPPLPSAVPLRLMAASSDVVDPAIDVVEHAEVPVGAAEILAATGVSEALWPSIRQRLAAERSFVAIGDRFLRWETLFRHITACVSEAGHEGLSKAEVLARLAGRGIPLDDTVWTPAIATMLERGRITKTGRARGTRYHT